MVGSPYSSCASSPTEVQANDGERCGLVGSKTFGACVYGESLTVAKSRLKYTRPKCDLNCRNPSFVKGGEKSGQVVSMVRINVRLSDQHKCHP